MKRHDFRLIQGVIPETTEERFYRLKNAGLCLCCGHETVLKGTLDCETCFTIDVSTGPENVCDHGKIRHLRSIK